MNGSISIQDLDNLLKANEEGKVELSKQKIELIEKLKNGQMIEKRYKDIIKQDIKQLEEKNNLDKKLDNEFSNFCEKTKTKSPQEILNSAYEITVKEELKDSLKNMNLFPLEITALLKQNDILNEFYHDWLNIDTPLGEVLENSIQESISMVTRYYENKTKDKER